MNDHFSRMFQTKWPTTGGLVKASINITLWLLFLMLTFFVIAVDYHVMLIQWDNSTLAASHGLHRAAHMLPPEGDFASLWLAGTLARTHDIRLLFQQQHFSQFRNAFFGRPVATPPWLYPPFALLPGFIMSFLPIRVAFWCWNIGTIVIATVLLRTARIGWRSIGLGLLGPAGITSLILGQYGVLVGAATITAILTADKKPRLSGCALALTVLKPQAALAIPITFAIKRQWKPLTYAVGAGAVLLVLDLLLFGISPWQLYLTKGLAESRAVLDLKWPQFNEMNGTSIFWMLRSFGSGITISWLVQLTSGFIAISIIAVIILRCRATLRRVDSAFPYAAIVCSASLLMSPYGYSDDMVGWSLCCAMLMFERGNFPVHYLLPWLWLWPGIVTIASKTTGILLTPFVVIILFLFAASSLTSTSLPSSRELMPKISDPL